MPRLMLVDDEVNILSSLRRALIAMPEGTFPSPLSIETFASPVQALARAHEMAFDLVISDYRMPEMDGVAFLEKLREIQKSWEEKLRQAEIDISMERAKLGRERSQLEEKLKQMNENKEDEEEEKRKGLQRRINELEEELDEARRVKGKLANEKKTLETDYRTLQEKFDDEER